MNKKGNLNYHYNDIKNSDIRYIPLKVTVIYAAIGVLWILLSDRLLTLIIRDAALINLAQTIKGWFYVMITAVIIYLLLKRGMKENEYLLRQLSDSNKELIKNDDKLKTSEEQYKFLAYHDMITNMPNKIAFFDVMKDILNEANNNMKRCALVFIDIDNFKNINDSLGYEMGDKVLKAIGDMLDRKANGEDRVFRLGGDEFLLIKPIINYHENINYIAEEILELFSSPIVLESRELPIVINVGVAVYPDHGLGANELLQNSSTAMNESRKTGKNKYKFYESNMHNIILENLELEKELRKALERKQFKLYYQPLIDSNTNEIVSVETLIRWEHPEKGIVSPDYFIPMAEESGLIIPIGEWVIRTACMEAGQWNKKYNKKVNLAVNISVVQMLQSNFYKTILNILEETGFYPEYLELEITESTLMKSLNSAIDVLQKLKDIGVKVSLDDFGTGYSSFSYLRNLPVNTLKIDKSFVRDIGLNRLDEGITEAIIVLAHKLDMDVVAEGVETKEQFDILKNQNCNKIQGYFIGKPMAKEQLIENWFKK